MSNNVKPIPAGMHTITPYIIVDDAKKAIAFYKEAFGAHEVMCMDMPNGKVMHAEIKIGDSTIMLGESCDERNCVSPLVAGKVTASLMMYSENVDQTFDKAVKAGCTVAMPVMDMFWGDRYGQVTDPFGHMWSLATHIEDVKPEDMGKRAAEAMKQMAGAGAK